MRQLVAGFTMIFFIGCVSSMPGGVRETVSQFDGSTEIKMEPGWVCREGSFGSCSIKLGLHRRSTMPAEDVVLTAMVADIHSFADGESLKLNVDGEILGLSSMDMLTSYDRQDNTAGPPSAVLFSSPRVSWSYKKYLVKKDLIKRLLDAKRVGVRIELSDSYVEGVFSYDRAYGARLGFREFYKKAFEVKL